MLFLIGFVCGFTLIVALLWLFVDEPDDKPVAMPPRQSIHEIERQAIREMVATAMVNGQVGNHRLTGEDGTQREVDQS